MLRKGNSYLLHSIQSVDSNIDIHKIEKVAIDYDSKLARGKEEP